MGNNTLYPNIPKAQNTNTLKVLESSIEVLSTTIKNADGTIDTRITTDELIKDLPKLEALAKEYLQTVKGQENPSQKDINNLVMDFLRRNDYSSNQKHFNQLAGKPDDGFMKWMRGEYEDKKGNKLLPEKQTDAKDLYHKYSNYFIKTDPKTGNSKYYYKLEDAKTAGAVEVKKNMILVDPQGKEQPLRHTIVCMQGVIQNGQKNGGVAITWGGDLSSVVAEQAVANAQGKQVNSNMFGEDQIRSDVDAVNMGLNADWKTDSISSIFNDYYSKQYSNRYTTFQDNLITQANKINPMNNTISNTTGAVDVLYNSSFNGEGIVEPAYNEYYIAGASITSGYIQGVSIKQLGNSISDANDAGGNIPQYMSVSHEEYRQAGNDFAKTIDRLAAKE